MDCIYPARRKWQQLITSGDTIVRKQLSAATITLIPRREFANSKDSWRRYTPRRRYWARSSKKKKKKERKKRKMSWQRVGKAGADPLVATGHPFFPRTLPRTLLVSAFAVMFTFVKSFIWRPVQRAQS